MIQLLSRAHYWLEIISRTKEYVTFLEFFNVPDDIRYSLLQRELIHCWPLTITEKGKQVLEQLDQQSIKKLSSYRWRRLVNPTFSDDYYYTLFVFKEVVCRTDIILMLRKSSDYISHCFDYFWNNYAVRSNKNKYTKVTEDKKRQLLKVVSDDLVIDALFSDYSEARSLASQELEQRRRGYVPDVSEVLHSCLTRML